MTKNMTYGLLRFGMKMLIGSQDLSRTPYTRSFRPPCLVVGYSLINMCALRSNLFAKMIAVIRGGVAERSHTHIDIPGFVLQVVATKCH